MDNQKLIDCMRVLYEIRQLPKKHDSLQKARDMIDRVLEGTKHPDQMRVVIWDQGMPQESHEYVTPSSSNWSMGEPITRKI